MTNTHWEAKYWEARALKAEKALDELRKSIRRTIAWLKKGEVDIIGNRCGAATCGFRKDPPMVRQNTKSLTERLEVKLSNAIDRSIKIMRPS